MEKADVSHINLHVFLLSSVLVTSFVLVGVLFTDELANVFTIVQDLIVVYLGWFYILSVAFFLVFVIWLYISPFGNIRLGKETDRPEYRNTTWIAMLFSAGMGIGLLFYSVAEPIIHFASPREAEPGSIDAAIEAMNLSFFHWGLHAWAIYIIVGLSLSYFSYRHDMPLTIRSTMYPIFGEKIYGIRGNIVEVLAIFGTLFGVATSLGLGVMQINAGMDYLGILSVSVNNQILLIALITLIATVSVASGLNRGIRILSQVNIYLAALLVIFVFIMGPTVFLLSSFVQSSGHYLQNIVALTFQTDAFFGVEWQKMWTMFYWGWWISWSPFVGLFIARISRGRTIKEFIRGALLAPVIITFMWIIVFGNTAIHMEIFGHGGIIEAVETNMPTALYVMLDKLPGPMVSSALATMVVMTFFVTSANSGSFVISILSSGGNPRPIIPLRIFWSVIQGAVAAVLLLTGGLIGLQTAALTTALPFCLVLLLMCYSTYKGLRAESSGQKYVKGKETKIEAKKDDQTRNKMDELFRSLKK